MISLYLRQSFRHKALRHFSVFWIMLCAFLLPLVVSVYRDSLDYGIRLQQYDTSKNQAIHISGAYPEDVELFRGIEGLTEPVYEDGTIYLTYQSDEEWKRLTTRNHPEFDGEDWKAFIGELNKLQEALYSGIGKSSHALNLLMYDYDMWHGYSKDPFMEAHMQDILYLNIALLLFSGLIVFSAYRNHIAGFSQEVADLAALGATKAQIIGLFLAEFLVLFPLAAAGAITLSWLVMQFLYEHFLGNMADSVAVWEVFHMDSKNTALEILFYFLVCLCAMTISLLHNPAKRKTKKCRYRPASLPRLWIHQTKPPFFRCLFILIPLLTAFILLFNRYLGLYARSVYGLPEVKIVVTSGNWGFSQEELDMVSKLGGVRRVEQMKESNRMYFLFTPQGDELTAYVHSYRDCASPLPPLEGLAVAADLQGAEVSGTYYLADASHPQDRREVQLVEIVAPGSQNSQGVNVYVSDTLMQELMAEAPVTRLEIYTSAQMAGSLEKELRKILPSNDTVSNPQNAVDVAVTRQEGRLLLLSWIFCILMLAAMQIIWVRLARYVEDCAPMLRTIFHVGGSRRQLAGLIPAWIGAVPAVVLPFAIAIPWAWLDASRSNRPFIISGPVLGIYLGIVLLAIATFWLPVKVSLKKILDDRK